LWPAFGSTFSPTDRLNDPPSPGGSIFLTTVTRAGRQLPKSRPRACGSAAASSIVHSHGSGYEQSQGPLSVTPYVGSSRSVYDPLALMSSTT
jgi:hypothetical protein